MGCWSSSRRRTVWASFLSAAAVLVGAFDASPARAQTQPAEVTFTKDIAPILQRSCENCHRPGGGAPMSCAPTKRCGRGRGPSSSAPASVPTPA